MSVKRRIITRLVFFVLLLMSGIAYCQPFPQWGGLEPGPFAVGYAVLQRIDHSRTFGTRTDLPNKITLDDHPRPIQINIWYPAVKNDSTERMKYEGYVEWIGVIGKSHSLNDEAKKTGRDEFIKYFISSGAPEEKINQLMNTRIAVVRNGIHEKGPFPLILFAPGIGDSPVMHTIICEYLASQGYIVASIPSMGWTTREMVPSASCIETQVRDLEYTIMIMREYPSVDIRRVGTIGFSLGSCSALILAMRNIDVDAVVSLDGSIGFKDRIARVKESPFYHPGTVQIPLLHLNIVGNKRNDLGIIDSMHSSLRTIIGIKGIGHMNFTAIGMVAGVMPGFLPSIEPNAKLGYETICRYTLHFLNAYIKDERQELLYLQNTARENNLPAGFIHNQIFKPDAVHKR
jgi:hypothetical protein